MVSFQKHYRNHRLIPIRYFEDNSHLYVVKIQKIQPITLMQCYRMEWQSNYQLSVQDPLPETVIFNIIQQLLQTLQLIHQNHIIHEQVCLENIYVDDPVNQANPQIRLNKNFSITHPIYQSTPHNPILNELHSVLILSYLLAFHSFPQNLSELHTVSNNTQTYPHLQEFLKNAKHSLTIESCLDLLTTYQ